MAGWKSSSIRALDWKSGIAFSSRTMTDAGHESSVVAANIMLSAWSDTASVQQVPCGQRSHYLPDYIIESPFMMALTGDSIPLCWRTLAYSFFITVAG